MEVIHERHIQSNSKIKVAICLTHTFEFISTLFFDFSHGLQSKYPLKILRSNKLPIDRNRTHLADLPKIRLIVLLLGHLV